jgi:membrane-associated protein
LNVLTSLQVDSVISYIIAVVIPALDAIFPVLPSETAIIALGVATAGSTDPRIALLVACAAAGAFLGDNLAYLIGRRFGPLAERKFFSTEKGARRRAWAEHSLERFGTQVIIVCRFFPGGRTAVTLTCGIIGYQRRKFIIATAAAAVIWALYAFFVGRLGGKVFEGKPWAGFLAAFGITLVVSALIEAVRRIRSRRQGPPDGTAARHGSRVRYPGQIEADHPGEDQPDRHQFQGGHRVAEEDHADRRDPGGTDSRPYGVRRPDLEVPQREGQQAEAHQRADGEPDGRPQAGHPVAHLQRHGKTLHPSELTPGRSGSGYASLIAGWRGIRVCPQWSPDEGQNRSAANNEP